jgi:hypothetical protein
MTPKIAGMKEKLRHTEHQLERALVLFTIASELHKSLRVDKIYEIMLDTLKQLIGVHSASICLYEGKGGKPEVVAYMGVGVKGQETTDTGRGLRTYPMGLEGKPLGEIIIVALLPQKKSLTTEDDELLTILAEQAAVAITSARAFSSEQVSMAALRTRAKKTTLSREGMFNKYLSYLRNYLGDLDADPARTSEKAAKVFFEEGLSGKEMIDIHLSAVDFLTGKLDRRLALRIVGQARFLMLGVLANLVDLYRASEVQG